MIFVILGHYYFCGYILSEVQEIKNYDPLVVNVSNDKSNEEIEEKKEVKSNEGAVVNKSYDDESLGILEISKIHLRKKLYEIGSYQNNVNRNIEVLKGSSMPNVLNGNLILAGHNGNTKVGYFRDLHKLILGDEVSVYYDNLNYRYVISKIYDVPKTGSVAIKRDKDKSTITLITCLGADRQLVVIGYLKK